MTEQIGINSYRILEHIHQSRRFMLFKAEAMLSGKVVLIKTQDPTQVQNKALADSLSSEAEAARRLDHIAIRKGIGLLRDGLNVYFLGEFIDGIALAGLINSEPEALTLEQALNWATSLAEVIRYASSRGVYHLSLNPYNTIIDLAQQLKVIGYGKSHEAWQNSEMNVRALHPILYVAPEVYQGTSVQAQADVYSWAVIVYQMLCASLPWRIDRFLSPEGQKQQSMSRSVIMPEILGKDVPDWLFALLLNCLNPHPQYRPDPNELCQALLDRGQISYPQEKLFWPVDSAEKPQSSDPGDIPVQTSIGFSETVAVPEPEVDVPSVCLEPDDTSKGLDEKDAAKDLFEYPEEESPICEEAENLGLIPPERPEPVLDAACSSEETAGEQSSEPIGTNELNVATPPETSPLQALSRPQQNEPLAEHKPAPVYPKYQHQPPEPEPAELSSLKKTFGLLAIISIFVVLFVVVKYVILAPRPQFEALEDVVTEEQDAPKLTENTALTMISVAADTLVMGSIAPEAEANEFPLLMVPIGSFMISTTEITQAQWNMVYEANPSQFRDPELPERKSVLMPAGANPSQFRDPELPVENVSFYDAVEYCNAKSRKDGLKPCYDYSGSEIICDFQADGYRLPTEAEWEFAAKAGIGKSFQRFSGSDNAADAGWSNANSGGKTNPVASKAPNSLGLYDMSGNVFEWVWNWYAPYTYNVTSVLRGPAQGTDKVIRGGSWYHGPNAMRTTARSYAKPFTKNGYTGFRVVRSR